MKRFLFALLALGTVAVLSAGGPISSQGAAPTTSFAGVIDPTNPAFSGGLHACSSSCSSFAESNRVALKQAIDYAATHNVWIHIPAGEYPIGCASGQVYGIDTGGDSNVEIRGYGATLRFTGDLGSADCSMLWVHNGAHYHFTGLTFSGRDIANTTTNANLVLVGDGGINAVDDVSFDDVAFVEGAAGSGDHLRLSGGTSAVTVTRVTVSNATRFEGSARAGVDVRPGVANTTISFSFFRSNANRDVWFEDTGDGPIGTFHVIANNFERASTATAEAVELSGHGATNSLSESTFSLNHIVPVVGQLSGGGCVVGHGLERVLIDHNVISLNRSTSTPNLDLEGHVVDVAVVDNVIERLTGASDAPVAKIATSGSNSPNLVQVRGNRIYQYSGASAGIVLDGTTNYTVDQNVVSYHNATADSGSTGFVGVSCSGTALSACSGTIGRNNLLQLDLATRASLDLATKTVHDNTVVESRIAGRPGNSVTIAFVGDSPSSGGSLAETGTATVVHYKPNVTTVASVENLLLASNNVQVRTSGTLANVLQAGDAFAATALSGAAQAGRPLAGIRILKGAGSTIGHTILRDNWISGARTLFYIDGDGSSQWPEGYPLVSGNLSTATVNEFEGGVTTYRSESVSAAESVTSGALSPTKRVSWITTSATTAYSLADGVYDGFEKCGKIKSYTAGTGTLTPSHFADGSTHTISWTAAGGFFCLAWDASATTWRLTGSSGVTIN